MKRTVPIVFSFDDNMLLPAKICIESLLVNAKPETYYDIFILYAEGNEVTPDDFTRLAEHYGNCRFTYRSVGHIFDHCFEIRGITTATYHRLAIPELIREYDTILYSDVDVIFRNDLSDLYFNTDMDDCYLAGVKWNVEPITEYTKQRRPIINIYAGNLIFNSKLIIRDNIHKRFYEEIKNKYKFQDNDIINIVCSGKILMLPPWYCVAYQFYNSAVNNSKQTKKLYSDKEIEYALDYGIIHYNGPKPWKQYTFCMDIWWEYYRKSIFFDHSYYHNFFNKKMNILDDLSLWKRLKLIYRYFRHFKKR